MPGVIAPGSRLPASPSASVSVTSTGVMAPAATAVDTARELALSTPNRVTACRARPAASTLPASRPPPPTGITAVKPLASCPSSSVTTVDCPAMTHGSA